MQNWIIVGQEVMREARRQKGLSREAVGRALNISAKTYERWESRGRIPRGDIKRVAKVLGLELEEVFTTPPATVAVPTEREAAEFSAELRQLQEEVRELRSLLEERLPPSEDGQAKNRRS